MAEQVPDSLSDEELLARIAAGEVAALATLFKRRQQNVYRFALHLTGSSSIADDVTQDVFIAVIKDAARFDASRATVAAWLCGIARNHVRRRLHVDRGVATLDDDSVDAALPVVAPDPLADLTQAERLESLNKAVLNLPIRYREVVVLWRSAGDAVRRGGRRPWMRNRHGPFATASGPRVVDSEDAGAGAGRGAHDRVISRCIA